MTKIELLKEIANKQVLLGDFGKEVEEYCYQHSKVGTDIS
jgi:hypothetical protein